MQQDTLYETLSVKILINRFVLFFVFLYTIL